MLEKYMQNCKSEIARTLYTNIFVALKAITWLFTSAPLIRQLLINIPFSNQNNLQNIINRQEYAYHIEILFAFSFVHYIYFKFQEAKDGSLTLNSLFDNQMKSSNVCLSWNVIRHWHLPLTRNVVIQVPRAGQRRQDDVWRLPVSASPQYSRGRSRYPKNITTMIWITN